MKKKTKFHFSNIARTHYIYCIQFATNQRKYWWCVVVINIIKLNDNKKKKLDRFKRNDFINNLRVPIFYTKIQSRDGKEWWLFRTHIFPNTDNNSCSDERSNVYNCSVTIKLKLWK